MAFTMGLGWYGNGTASKSNGGATQPCGPYRVIQRLEQHSSLWFFKDIISLQKIEKDYKSKRLPCTRSSQQRRSVLDRPWRSGLVKYNLIICLAKDSQAT